jgi:phage terminase large subunit
MAKGKKNDLENVVNGVWLGHRATQTVYASYMKEIPLVILAGGSYAGKTSGALCALLLLAQSQSLRIVVFCENFPLLKRDAMHWWDHILSALGVNYEHNKTYHTYTIGQSTVEFRALDSAGTARGAKQDISYIVEINLIDKARYDQIMMRTNRMMVCCFNPSEKFWLFDQVVPHEDNYIFKRFTYKDNPFTPDKVKKTLEGYKDSDEELYKVYTLGLWGKTEGNIYSRPTIIDSLPDSTGMIRAFGVDFGYSKDPSVLLAVLIDYKNKHLYVDELFYQTGHTAYEFGKNVRHLARGGVTWCDSARPDSIDELKKLGIDARPVRKVKDSITIGIDYLKTYKWFVTSRSTNLLTEIQRYKYRLLKDGTYSSQPVDNFNHALDALRYVALEEIPNPFPSRKLKSVAF